MQRKIIGMCLGLALWHGAIGAQTMADIVGHSWVITSLFGKEIDPTQFPGEKPEFTFNQDNTYSAYGGCNRISGSYTLNEQQLTFAENAAMTKMYCAQNYNVETDVLTLLQESASWSFSGNTLNLLNDQQISIATLVAK